MKETNIDPSLRIVIKGENTVHGIRDSGGYLLFFPRIQKYEDYQDERFLLESAQQRRLAEFLLNALKNDGANVMGYPPARNKMLAKNGRIEMPKLLKAANGQSCIKCGVYDKSVVPAHYSGLWAHRLGNGVGTKCHDFCVADLCRVCRKRHADFDDYSHGNDWERSTEFLVLCFETLARRVRDGVIK